MAKIFIIDDDAAADLLAENLVYRGHDAKRIRSVHEALKNVHAVSGADLVVLDLVMPSGAELGTSAEGHRAGGMAVYKRLREISHSLPIIVYTANQDGGIIDVINSDKSASYVPRWSGPSLGEFIGLINERLGIQDSDVPLKVFIVHGHDEVVKLSLKNYLQNVLRLPEPIILHEQPNLGRTIIEKFEDLSRYVDLVFVLLTPDDPTATASDSDSTKRRARQNVIFELGYFLGQLGRRSGRVFLLYKGNLELPSDLSGVLYLNIDSGIEAVGEKIRLEISSLSK
jgi:CheY-like chemotaxis protein